METFAYDTLQPTDLYGSQIDRKYRVRANPQLDVSQAQPAAFVSTASVPGPESERAGKDYRIPPAGDGMYALVAAPETY